MFIYVPQYSFSHINFSITYTLLNLEKVFSWSLLECLSSVFYFPRHCLFYCFLFLQLFYRFEKQKIARGNKLLTWTDEEIWKFAKFKLKNKSYEYWIFNGELGTTFQRKHPWSFVASVFFNAANIDYFLTAGINSYLLSDFDSTLIADD